MRGSRRDTGVLARMRGSSSSVSLISRAFPAVDPEVRRRYDNPVPRESPPVRGSRRKDVMNGFARGVLVPALKVVGPPCRAAFVEGTRGCSPRGRPFANRRYRPWLTLGDGSGWALLSSQPLSCSGRVRAGEGGGGGDGFAGFDVHRAQITFDALDSHSGEVTRGGSSRRRRR